MWMTSADGAAVLDDGLISAMGIERVLIFTSDTLTPLANYLSVRVDGLSPEDVERNSGKLSAVIRDLHLAAALEWQPLDDDTLDDQLAEMRKVWPIDESYVPDETKFRPQLEEIRQEFPERTDVLGVGFVRQETVSTPLSKVWMELLHQPLIPFDHHEIQKLIDRLPPKYRDWVGAWRKDDWSLGVGRWSPAALQLNSGVYYP